MRPVTDALRSVNPYFRRDDPTVSMSGKSRLRYVWRAAAAMLQFLPTGSLSAPWLSINPEVMLAENVLSGKVDRLCADIYPPVSDGVDAGCRDGRNVMSW